jgi:hypothetical protein
MSRTRPALCLLIHHVAWTSPIPGVTKSKRVPKLVVNYILAVRFSGVAHGLCSIGHCFPVVRIEKDHSGFALLTNAHREVGLLEIRNEFCNVLCRMHVHLNVRTVFFRRNHLYAPRPRIVESLEHKGLVRSRRKIHQHVHLFQNKMLRGSATLSNCTAQGALATITNMVLTPSNPVPGDVTTLQVDYELKTPVESGTAKYSVSLNGIPFPTTYDDLCTQTECPKDVGNHSEISKSTFPDVSGKIVSGIEWTTSQNEQIWCMAVTYRT